MELGINVADILSLSQTSRSEGVALDRVCLDRLYNRLGFHDADQLVCRAVDEIATRVTDSSRYWSIGDWGALLDCVNGIDKLATQVGMPALARCARDVAGCIRFADRPALDATLWRMTHLGEASVAAVSGQQDLSL